MTIDTAAERKLHEATTQGEWANRTHNGMPVVYCKGYPVAMVYADNPSNAAFIAHAHTQYHALLDEIDKGREAARDALALLQRIDADTEREFLDAYREAPDIMDRLRRIAGEGEAHE